MHVNLLLYIPSNNAGKMIITKTFSVFDSDPVRSRVEGSPASSRYPGRVNFLYISLENSSNRLYAKHRLGSARTRRANFLSYGRSVKLTGTMTLLTATTFVHVNRAMIYLMLQFFLHIFFKKLTVQCERNVRSLAG